MRSPGTSYSGGALPGLLAGELSRTTPLPDVDTGYVGHVVVASLVALMAGARPRTARADHPRGTLP